MRTEHSYNNKNKQKTCLVEENRVVIRKRVYKTTEG